MRNHGHSARWVMVWPYWRNGQGKWLLAVVCKVLYGYHFSPKMLSFLGSEILILNRWHDLLKTFKPRKQAEKLISNHHYSILQKNSMKYDTFLINFSWIKQTLMKGLLCASRWIRNGFCSLRAWISWRQRPFYPANPL